MHVSATQPLPVPSSSGHTHTHTHAHARARAHARTHARTHTQTHTSCFVCVPIRHKALIQAHSCKRFPLSSTVLSANHFPLLSNFLRLRFNHILVNKYITGKVSLIDLFMIELIMYS